MKKFEIAKTKPTFIISVLKIEYYLGGLSFFDFQLNNKIFHANKWMRKKKYLLAVIQLYAVWV